MIDTRTLSTFELALKSCEEARERRARQSDVTTEAVSLEAKKTRAAAVSGVQEAADLREGYRRISGDTHRDLSPLAQDKMIQMAWYIYDRNLFAKRLVGFMTEFVVGEGIKLNAKDPQVQEVLDEFWNDPYNRMKLNLESHVRELSIFGEQFLVAHVNAISGRVRLGTLDPFDVEQVAWGSFSADGLDVVAPIEVKTKSQTGRPARTLKVINVVEDPAAENYGFRDGQVFMFAINKAKRGTRGRSDLFAAVDYIDGYDQLLFSALERFDVSTRVFEDVTLEGFTEEECRAWAQRPENRVPPRPLSKRVHNEKTKFEIQAPNLGAYELENAGAKLIRNFILGGTGFPNFWFGGGDETNLATAVEQGTPTFKMLAARQLYVRAIVEDIANFVIDCAILAGRLPKTVDRSFDTEAAELSTRDATKISGALNQVTFSLQAAVAEGWLTFETAARIFAGLVTQLGYPVDVDAELAELATRPRPEEVDYEGRSIPKKPSDAKNPAREEAREENAV